ncbi:hypothetical protein BYT27DRAFT_6844760 [Phlegmacium glaucopus]|nr:hypothetical protein BYT27DRAFT_6844760 [Phlegmacium glaucopus]
MSFKCTSTCRNKHYNLYLFVWVVELVKLSFRMHRPLLTDLSLDVQIHICEFLHPSQILALGQTCKVIHEATSRRIVWIHALNRICRENLLFLPTFPIAATVEVLILHSLGTGHWVMH